MEVQHIIAAGRTRGRPGQSCTGSGYDLLACLADAAAAAPLGVPALHAPGASQRQMTDRAIAAQTGPANELQLLVRRRASGGPVSPSPPADTDVAGTSNLHTEREVRVTCNGTLGTFLIPSQTVQCHCARCAPEGATGENLANGDGAGIPHHQGPPITPTEFERHSGLLTAKKWRNSIRLVQGDGTLTIGKWLEQHNILPRPKCSGPLGSPGTGTYGIMAAVFGSGGFGADGIIHLGGTSLGHDNSHIGGEGGMGHGQGAVHAQLGRCTLPPSRYPASEYVTGEDDEYDEAGARLNSAADGINGDRLAAGEDPDRFLDDDDYEDGLYGDAVEAAGSHGGGRSGRRGAVHRGGRSGTGLKLSDRRGTGRALGRTAGGSRAAPGRGQRGRQPGMQRCAPLYCVRQQQQQQLLLHMQGRAAGGSQGAVGAQRGAGSGGGHASSQEGGEGEEEDGMGKGHSSSEGSLPSDDSKRHLGGSGGSGEGDGSGTGDGGDSRRPGPVSAEGERRTADEAGGGCPRRSTRHGSGPARTPMLQLQHPPQHSFQGGRAGSVDATTAQERSTRHAAAIKRLSPEYLTGAEIGPLLKRARTRPSGALSAGCGSGSGSWGLGGDELTALYDMAVAPQVRGWRFLGASADPGADQVLISVTINGRTYNGLLAPQQSAPSPPPTSVAPATAAAGLQAAVAAPGSSYAAGGIGGGGGVNVTGGTATGALSARRPGGGGASVGGRALTASTGRTNLPSLGPSSRLGVLSVDGTASGARQEDGDVSKPMPTAAAVEESADATTAAAATTTTTTTEVAVVATAVAMPSAAEDEFPDDGMPPECPRCGLCHRCAVPTLALPPPTSSPGPLPSPSQARAKTVAPTEVNGAYSPEAPVVMAPVESPANVAATVIPGKGFLGGQQDQEAPGEVRLSITTEPPPELGKRSSAESETAHAREEDPASGPAAAAATGVATAVSSGCDGEEYAMRTADLKPLLCTSCFEVKAEAAGLEATVLPEMASAIKAEIKSEGDSRSEPGLKLQAQGSAPEASRTARQAGCGLGPLVEVRCNASDGAGSSAGATAPVVVHSQCALWSPDVFVIGGTMYGVSAMIRRSRGQRCAHCGRTGASLSCSSGRCGRTYHLPCAIEAGAMLVAEPYSMACPLHRNTAALHTALSTGIQSRLPPSRLRPAPSQEASQSTVTTLGAAPPHSNPQTQSRPQSQQQQVSLPLSLQLAAGRRIVLPPLAPAPAGPSVPPTAGDPAATSRSCRCVIDANGLPALMMLRTQAEGSHAAVNGSQNQTSSMPPPQRQDATAAVAIAANLPIDPNGCEGAEGGSGSGGKQIPTEASEPPAKRPRASGEAQQADGSVDGSGVDVLVNSDGGAAAKVTAAGLAFVAAPWAQGQPPVFERRQSSAAAAIAATTAAGIVTPNTANDGAGVPAGMSSAQLEMSVASEGAAAVNSQGQSQQAHGANAVKCRREGAIGEGDGATATAPSALAGAETLQLTGHYEGTVSAGVRQPTLTQALQQQYSQPQPQQQQEQELPQCPQPPLGVGAMPSMFLARGAVAATSATAADEGAAGGGPGDTLGLGLGLGLDPASGLHLSHASAWKLLQQHPQLGGALPEGVAAMLLAAHQNHHNSIANSAGGLLRQGGEISAGSHGSTAAQPQPQRGRSRHHHHYHHHYHHHNHNSSPHQQGGTVGASASTASASTGTGFGSGAGGRGDDKSPSPQFHVPSLPIQQLQQPYSSSTAGILGHMLPRAARNIEGLLPSRPLLHNPYVPSSGDPSADLMLSKIAQNGSREVEAELLGGTTGRVGHTGRCAVCVIQRKGKCGTESAPKKCLRRQLVALQRATGSTSSGAALAALSGLSGGPGSAGIAMAADDTEEAPYATAADVSGSSGAGAAALFLDDRVAAAAAEQRARERARRETWSLPLGVGSGATGKRPPQPSTPQEQFAAM